jgi:hypothetical protein
MISLPLRHWLLPATGSALLGSLCVAGPIPTKFPFAALTKLRPSQPQTAELKAALASKKSDVAMLREQATSVATRIAGLAGTGKLEVTDETVALLQSLVEELQQVNSRLKKVEADIADINAWIEERGKETPVLKADVEKLKRFKPSSYVQFQFRESDDEGAETSAFSNRRVRLGTEFRPSPRTVVKTSFDLASGTTGTQAQLRDAFAVFSFSPKVGEGSADLHAGQQPLLLGQELARSSAEREFPERARYNTTMFSGERGRGVAVRYGIGPNAHAHLGLFDALTFNDPEQSGLAPGPSGKLAWIGGARVAGKGYDVGASALLGARPGFEDQAGNFYERTERRFLYVDGTFPGLIAPGLTLRTEAMWGRDRVPVRFDRPAPGRAATDMYGSQAQLSYDFDPRNRLSVRYEVFDPDSGRAGDLFGAFGLAYSHELAPGARLVIAWERLDDPARPRPYSIVTLRTQFRY